MGTCRGQPAERLGPALTLHALEQLVGGYVRSTPPRFHHQRTLSKAASMQPSPFFSQVRFGRSKSGLYAKTDDPPGCSRSSNAAPLPPTAFLLVHESHLEA